MPLSSPVLAAARSPATPPPELTRLAREDSDEVRAAVAANPATPGAVLAGLCERFAPQVLANPALPLWLLADPVFFASLTTAAALAVTRQGPLEAWVLESLAGHDGYPVRVQVVLHASTSAALLRRLAVDPNPFVRRAVGSRPRCPPAVLRALAADRDPFARSGVAMNAACPLALLETLARDDDAGVRSVVANRRSR